MDNKGIAVVVVDGDNLFYMDHSERQNNGYDTKGKEDIFIQKFLEEDELLDKKGISCIRHMYEGGHDWNVWRHCIRDFA